MIEKKSRFDVLPNSDLGATISFAAATFGGGIYFARSWILVWLPALVLLIVANYLLKRRQLVIGHDGVLISQLGKRRFISYRDVESVNRFADVYVRPKRGGRAVGRLGLVLHLKRNEHVSVPMMRNGRQRKDDLVDAHERIAEALAAWQSENPSEDSDLLRRGARSTKDWLAALRRMGSTEENIAYRVAPVDRGALLAIAEDPVNQAHLRAAAAIVLREKWTTDERARLEASAKTIAEPRLRVAMDQVLEKKVGEDLDAVFDDLDRIESKIR